MARQSSSAEMPFLDHLEELRQRLLRAGAAFIVGVIVAFTIVMNFDIIGFLQRPIRPYLGGRTLVYTHPGDVFGILIDMAFVLGAIIASPVIAYQIWLFVAPAMLPREKRMVVPVLAGMLVLFLAGVALSFFVVLPLTMSFLLGLQAGALTPMITASDYFGFAVSMSLMFGVAFELPIAILALTALGIVTPAMLVKFRRHAAVSVLVLAAFVTPGSDPTSLVALAVPLYFLYELSVVMSKALHRRQLKRQARRAAEERAEQQHVGAPA
ncbi:twin-arginine translocase subunit TatC [soil metagenome]